MSEFHVEVVRLGPVLPLENSEALDITTVHGEGGYPCIVKRGDFKPGDLAVYIPINSVVPAHPRFEFLKDHRRIKARRLRGTFSMGLLMPADPEMTEGQDVAALWGIEKYEPAEHGPMRGSCTADDADPGILPCYTDIEGLRRHPSALIPGEEVVITEKIHGENGRAVHDGTRLHIGSRTRFKKDDPASRWWQAARSVGLPEKLAAHPMVGVYGESHGYTGGFAYGAKNRTPQWRVFDVLDAKTGRYLDYDDMAAFCQANDLPMAPVLYRGPWHEGIRSLADGMSTIDPSHIREGIVVRPVRERFHPRLGRVILKLHGEAFLLKNAG